MSWLEIVMIVMNLVFGGGFVVTAVTLKQTRAKAVTEVQMGNVDLINVSVKGMLESIQALTRQNNELVEKLVAAERMNQHFQRKIINLEKKLEAFILISEQLVRVFDKITPPHLAHEMHTLKRLIDDEKANG
ncbi:MAG: hypothetical protein ACNA7V_06730 [Bacteroidales bacterium]